METELKMIIDTHAHLDDERFGDDLQDVMDRAREAGVGRIVTVGTDVESSRRAVEIANRFDDVFAAVGIHPHCAGAIGLKDLEHIATLTRSPKVVGVGETGLDFYRDRSPQPAQRRLFRSHIRLAREAGLPLVVHSRAAAAEAMDELEGEKADRVVLHCFDGTVADVKRARTLGYFIGVTNVVTYPNADVTRECAKAAGLENLLVETDAPYLPPQSRRGKRNEPAFLLEAVEALSSLFAAPKEKIACITTANAQRLFFLKIPIFARKGDNLGENGGLNSQNNQN